MTTVRLQGTATTASEVRPKWRFGFQHLMLCASVIVLMFSNDENYSYVFQVAGVGLLMLSAGGFLVFGAPRRLNLSYFDIVMLTSVLFSYLATIITQDVYVLMHTTVFLFTYISIMIIAQRAKVEELSACIQLSLAIVLVLAFALYGGRLLTSLTPGALRRWELRFAPFDMHPNLAGFVYGGFIVALAHSRLNLRRYAVLVKAVLIGLGVAIMLAASARAGLLAVVVTLIVYLVVETVRFGRSLRYIVVAGIVVTLGTIVYWDRVASYMTEMLDLDSKERGLSSGGTGRMEIWQQGLDYIGGRTWQLLIGSGLRSATMTNMGFPTEDSYINLLVESGPLWTVAVLGCLLYVLGYSYRHQDEARGLYKIAFYTLLFAMFQSVFNRYLIAIGNPFSLILLIIISKASLGVRGQSSSKEKSRHNFPVDAFLTSSEQSRQNQR